MRRLGWLLSPPGVRWHYFHFSPHHLMWEAVETCCKGWVILLEVFDEEKMWRVCHRDEGKVERVRMWGSK